jgi:xanthine dehydrogenase large subunit
MRVERCQATRCWEEADRRFDFERRRAEIAEQNRAPGFVRRGVALMPICFGISFTNTMLNQAGALVHVYGDGSVGVSTGAVEMGQGVSEKIARVAARTLSVDRERVKVESTNTTRVANTSPTAASTGADMNGNATRLACRAIRDRLLGVAAVELGLAADTLALEDEAIRVDGRSALGWQELVQAAYTSRTNLSAQAHYATPGIQLDKATGKGKPFAYHVYGVALIEAEVDILRGTYRVDAVRLVHDAGESIDPLIDRGQIEGALVQGLGLTLLEELVHDGAGRLLTDRLDTYKIPDIHFTPATIEIALLPDSANPLAPFNSKAVGEPPLMYGIGAWFAVADALRAHDPGLELEAGSPWTPEKVLLLLAERG